ncbi:hypothetical protein BC937DRAFT_95350, partial [Endogone sp. FLAS-F59071]
KKKGKKEEEKKRKRKIDIGFRQDSKNRTKAPKSSERPRLRIFLCVASSLTNLLTFFSLSTPKNRLSLRLQMSAHTSYSSYISSLNSLESSAEPTLSQEDLADELALWTNAQFTFDIPPGMRILDDNNSLDITKLDQQTHQQPSSPVKFEPLDSATDALTLEGLAQYLDSELSNKQDLQHVTSLPSVSASTLHSRHSSSRNAHLNAALLQPLLLASAATTKSTSKSTTKSTSNIFPSLVPPSSSYLFPPTLLKPSTSAPTAPLLLVKPPGLASASASTSTSPSAFASAPANPKKRLSIAQHPDPSIASSPAAATNAAAATSDLDLPSKLAAEEDKRRRNTAASARFRVKKKQREQALERTAREMTTKADMLGDRVRELEMEVRWLRGLIVEKDSRLLDLTEGQSTAAEVDETEVTAKRAKVDGDAQ